MASSKSVKGGTRVRLEADERLDNPDALALQELGYDYTSDLAGAMLGGSQSASATLPVGGSTSKLVFDASTPSATTIRGPGGLTSSKAMFLFSHPAQTGYSEIQAMVYDPSATGQQNTIDLSAYSAGQIPIIWARRVDVNLDADTRYKWDKVSAEEASFSLATREGYRILFDSTLSTSPPDTTVGWFAVAQVTAISGSGDYTFRTVHPFDCGRKPSDNSGSAYYNAPFSNLLEVSYDHVGLMQAVRYLYDLEIAYVQSLQSQISSNGSDIDTNAAGLVTTNLNVTNLYSITANHTTQINGHERVTPMFVVVIEADGSGDWAVESVGGYDRSLSSTSLTAGDISMTYSSSPWHIFFEVPIEYAASDVTVTLSSSASTFPTYMCCGSVSPTFGVVTRIVLNTIVNMAGGGAWTSFPAGNPAAGTQIVIVGYSL